MRFSFETPRGTLVWEDGKLSGPSFLVQEIREDARAREGRGHTYGSYPSGPFRAKEYLRDPFSAFEFLTAFFRDNRMPAKIDNIPIPEAPPGGAVQ